MMYEFDFIIYRKFNCVKHQETLIINLSAGNVQDLVTKKAIFYRY